MCERIGRKVASFILQKICETAKGVKIRETAHIQGSVDSHGSRREYLPLHIPYSFSIGGLIPYSIAIGESIFLYNRLPFLALHKGPISSIKTLNNRYPFEVSQ